MIGVLYWARIVFITATIAVVTALILDPFVGLLEKIRLPRALASFVVCLFAVMAVYFAGLAAYNQLSSVASDVPAFKEHLAEFVGSVSERIQYVRDASARILMPTRNSPAPGVAPASANVSPQEPEGRPGTDTSAGGCSRGTSASDPRSAHSRRPQSCD